MLVEPTVPEEKTPGGIIVPSSSKQASTSSGKVLACKKEEDLMGKTVWFSHYSGTEIELGGKKLRIVTKKDLLGFEE